MEEPIYQEERVSDQAKTWLQENLRIIVSIFIVAAIALGIYSYSQRGDETVSGIDDTTVMTDDAQDSLGSNGTVVTDNAMTGKETVKTPVVTSQETETSFVEAAVRGDGTTHLARRALMNYLEKSPDSSLSAEHKVYIEDYLRKNVGHRGGLEIGDSVEFSKDLVRQAIASSKTLSEKQLQNLKQYSVRVSAYRS
jgi:hypothetical protein